MSKKILIVDDEKNIVDILNKETIAEQVISAIAQKL